MTRSVPSPLGPILCIVGARPNFMKMAPILRALTRQGLSSVLVHTGQHYDLNMSDRLFQDLEMRQPDVNLEVGSASHAVQTAEVMRRFEPVLDAHGPACVLVVGDVNSTLACALVAVKKDVAVAHVEAGLRSFDRRMPEEINRVLTDQIADRLYTTEREAESNLLREGIDSGRVVFVGNVMIDSLHTHRARAVDPADTLRAAGQHVAVVTSPQGFGLVTLHRPSNVDDPVVLRALLGVLVEVSQRVPLVFALHPRTHAAIKRSGLEPLLADAPVALLPPQGYLQILGLMSHAKFVATDSGGMQEETTALGVPCITLRENTERPITVDSGTNTVVGRDRKAILACVDEILAGGGKRGRVPELWDGHAAERIAGDLARWLHSRRVAAAAA